MTIAVIGSQSCIVLGVQVKQENHQWNGPANWLRIGHPCAAKTGNARHVRVFFLAPVKGRQESSLLDGCTPKTYREYIPHVCINSTTNQFDIRI